jgi:hypothetical protein
LASYVNELVSSQLLVHLPQNSGARGKGNWPLETGQLQSLADCPISWRCDITSKRASKSKSSIRKEMTKASGLEVHSSRGRGYVEVQKGETCRLQSRPSQHGCGFHPSLLKPVLTYTFRSRIAEAFSFHAKAGWARQECLIGWVAILAPTYKHPQG